MPIYEYRCDRCEKTFEKIQKFSDEPVTVHEGCGGAVERLISSSALQFKGTGWYVTDYARKNGASGSGGSKSDSKSESKSDSKSESKSESKGGSNGDSKPAASTKTETTTAKSDKK
jgi:putative FmdB family regulatory protein